MITTRHAIFDFDGWLYRYGFAYQAGGSSEPLDDVCEAMQLGIEAVLYDCIADSHELWIAGDSNYRDDIATIQKYKDRPSIKPECYSVLREYAIDELGAHVATGEEADDAVGIRAATMYWELARGENNKDPIIVTNDKDLNNIAGLHYDWVKRKLFRVSLLQAERNFYTQLLSGDTTDTIPGLFRITGARATKKIKEKIEDLNSSEDMYNYIHSVYRDKLDDSTDSKVTEILTEIGRLLWIRREPNELWIPPQGKDDGEKKQTT